MAAGLIRPSIVMPAGIASAIDRDQLRDVLVHEVAHIVRRDHLVVLCQTAARVAFWPIVTIHLLNRALSRAREEVCDNYVLAGRAAVDYGETLLRVASLSGSTMTVPLAVGILPRRGRLENRIAGLIDSRRNRKTHPGRFAAVLIALILVSVTAVVSGAQIVSAQRAAEAQAKPASIPSDAETVRKLIADLKTTEAAIKNVSVTTSHVLLQARGLPVKEPVRRTLVTKSIVTFDGKAWNESFGQGINIEPNGKDIRLFNMRSRGAFDGKVARNMHASGNNDFRFGSIADFPNWHWVDPREFTTHYIRQPVSQILIARGATLFKRDKWDDRPVVVVDTTPVKNGAKYKFRFWIDPERKIVVRRAMLMQHKPDQRYQEYARIASFDHKQIAPGIWLPDRMTFEQVGVTAAMTPERLMMSDTGFNADWKVNQKLSPDKFVLNFPKDVFVNDHRAETRRKKNATPKKKTSVTADAALARFLARLDNAPKPPIGKGAARYTKDTNGRVTVLRLREIRLNRSELALIARLRHLVSLDLSSTQIDDGVLVHLKNLRNLRRLSLWNNPIKGDGLAHLHSLSQLERLDLGDTHVSDASLRHLVGLQKLRHLTLTRNDRVTDAAFGHIAKLKNLKTLKIGETSVSDAGIKHIKTMETLRGVTLDRTRVTEEGIEELAQDSRFKWMATPRQTGTELARRMERGDFASVQDLLSIGLRIPNRGIFREPKLKELPRTDRDRKLGRQLFRLEMRWIHQQDKIDDQYYVVFAVDRGAIGVHSMGIIQ